MMVKYNSLQETQEYQKESIITSELLKDEDVELLKESLQYSSSSYCGSADIQNNRII